MGLLRESDSVATQMIVSSGVEPNRLYTDIINVFGTGDYRQQAPAPGKMQHKKSETKTLDQFSRDLTVAARNGTLDPVIGRENEIQRVVQILSRRSKNNPVLIGEPGVGKTAIAEGLAQKIISGDVPENLRDKRIVTLDLSGMLAGDEIPR